MGKKIDIKIYNIIREVEALSFTSLECLSTNIHGVQHLRQVAFLAGRFAYSLNVDYKTAIIGGYLHDCARSDDGGGNSHAHESAFLAKRIIETNWSSTDIDKIFYAIYYHADGLNTNDPFIGCIWDADRLNLVRLGLIPKVELLSTEFAKRIHTRFIQNHRIFSHILKIALNLQKQLKEKDKASIGIWYTENSNIVLQLLFNLLEDSFSFDFTKLSIVSLYEYSNVPKNHDQSCCYQIYKSCSNRVVLDQIGCPEHDFNYQEITLKDIPCIISYEYPYYPFLNSSILAKKENRNYSISIETRNYLSRFYEKINNTPDSIKTFSADFYINIDNLIVLVDKSFVPINSKIATIIPESWLVSAFNINTAMNINKYM